MKINTFAIISFTTLGNGVSSFTAQNLGAGRTGRVVKGFKAGITLVLCVAIPAFLLFFFAARPLAELFMSAGGERAANVGVEFLRIVSPFYVVVSFKLISDGILRGAGAMKAFMISTFSDLILRVVLAFVLSGLWQDTGKWKKQQII